MTSLPMILGEAPSKSGDRYYLAPLSGEVGKRLCTWAGITPLEKGSEYGKYYWALREHFELRNLLERYPGPRGKGAAFPAAAARRARLALEPELRGRIVVLLGRRLAHLFDMPGVFFQWRAPAGGVAGMVVIPHPSGLNQVYDDRGARDAAGRVLVEAMAYAREGRYAG